jgi:hypothetical protein
LSCVLWSGVVIFAVGVWFIHGKSVYKGPVMETNMEEVAVRREV